MNLYLDKVLVPTIKTKDVLVKKLIKKPELVIKERAEINKVKVEEDRITIISTSDETENQALRYIDQLLIQYEDYLPICEFEFYSPSYRYRGFHLDCVRATFSIEEIKRIIKACSLVGYNYFHFHLTDDQGWRFPVEGYDKLETISSKRNRYENDDNHHVISAFYTLDELKEIEEYSKSLGITVIPEIEMPGHAEALLAAYPEMGCTGKEIPVQDNYGIFENVMNPASPYLWTFLDKAIETLSSVFSGPFLHIGGDECPHKQWSENEDCLALMKREGIDNVDDLQGWFTTKAAALVKKYGKRAIGWDEVVDAPKIDENVVVMSWRGLDGARIATQRGHEVILCPETNGCYFDRYPTNDSWEKGNLSKGFPSSLFALDICMEEELGKERSSLILGAQCNLWCEKIDSGREAEFMYFPRAFILAENLWLGKNKDWDTLVEKKKALSDLCYNLNILSNPAPWV